MEYEVITDCLGKETRTTYETRKEAYAAFKDACTYQALFSAMLVVRYETGRTKTLEAFGDC